MFGLHRNNIQRRALFRHLHAIYPKHLVCLQETHSVENDERRWRCEWGAQMFMTHGQSLNQRGVAILIPNGFGGVVKQVNTGRSDRMIVLEIQCYDVTFYVAALYAPNSNRMREQIEFLRALENQLNALPDASKLFVCGDFDIHRAPIDTSARFSRNKAA